MSHGRSASADGPTLWGHSDEASPRDLLVEQKLANLRLIRALDAAQIEPTHTPALFEHLAHLAEYDMLLLSGLELLHRPNKHTQHDELRAVIELAETGDSVRQQVLNELTAREEMTVRTLAPKVGASETEVDLELEALRQESAHDSSAEADDASTGDDDSHLDKIFLDPDVLRAIARVGPPPPPQDPKVETQEAKPLPISRAASAEAWLVRLPANWLKAMARLHGLGVVRRKADAAEAVAARLGDPSFICATLEGALGLPEQVLLAELVQVGEIWEEELEGGLREGFRVPWDWSTWTPSTSAQRLRAYGFVHLGTRAGRRIVAVPRGLHKPIARAVAQLLEKNQDFTPDSEELIEDLRCIGSGIPFRVSYTIG